MKVTVIEVFQDKLTKQHHQIGDVINIDDKSRVEMLCDMKLVKVAEAVAETKKTATRSKKEQ